MSPPAPVIRASSSLVAVGGNLRVSCSAVGEQDVVVEFTWEYPGQQVRKEEGAYSSFFVLSVYKTVHFPSTGHLF